MNQREQTSSSYDSVIMYYLAVGAVGLLFLAGSILSQFGWLESIIRAIFREQSEPVLESVYGLGIMFTFAFGFYFVVGWIPAIWITIRYRKMWPIWVPSVYFLLLEVLLLATLDSNWAIEQSYEWAIGTVIGLYFLANFLVGLQMVARRRPPSKPEGLLGS